MSQRASPRFKGGAGCTTCHVPHFVVSFVYACFGCCVKGGMGGYCLCHGPGRWNGLRTQPGSPCEADQAGYRQSSLLCLSQPGGVGGSEEYMLAACL